jgi:catechol 2,3-dioxygenase
MSADRGAPFQIQKLGHVVLNCTDLEASTRFYNQVLGFEITERYDSGLAPGGMVFLRCSPDHHNLALVGGAAPAAERNLNHFALEVATLDEIFQARDWLRQQGVPIHFEGRRRAGCQISLEFSDPDGNHVELYWGVDKIGTHGGVRPSSEWRPARSLEEALANPVAGQRHAERPAPVA